ncbi:GLPGLI family protein [Chryseobacterium paludis]|uniref:GLPGLI family protein n=1 Tax=Chryseobacterium paludis TaxID=2956784 RepID=UPI0021C189AA|nr:GLPGLI family protein [Chryseobacterium paludis]
MKKISIFLTFFLFALFYSQADKKDSINADFTYLLKAKIYKSTPNYIHQEFFSLQVLNDRAFFVSEKALKFDSIFQSEFQKAAVSGSTNINFSGKSFPKTKFPYTIIQTNKNIQYFEKVGMALLSYKESTINNWNLINESKIINSFNCKKAEVSYKGRNWIAWYSTDIPLTYGPYKFTGLPGLIIKISDQNGDYDFELVKSVSSGKLKGRVTTISKRRYENAKETSIVDLQEAKKNFTNNMIGTLESMETTIAPEQRENLRQIQKQKQQNMNDENSIEQVK